MNNTVFTGLKYTKYFLFNNLGLVTFVIFKTIVTSSYVTLNPTRQTDIGSDMVKAGVLCSPPWLENAQLKPFKQR